jgi:hypothetical protein
MLLDDHMVVDVCRPFIKDSYFGIERTWLEPRRHQPPSHRGGWLAATHTRSQIEAPGLELVGLSRKDA